MTLGADEGTLELTYDLNSSQWGQSDGEVRRGGNRYVEKREAMKHTCFCCLTRETPCSARSDHNTSRCAVIRKPSLF